MNIGKIVKSEYIYPLEPMAQSQIAACLLTAYQYTKHGWCRDLQRFTSYEFLDSLTPRSILLTHLLTLFVIQLLKEYAPTRLILLLESLEFCIHRSSLFGNL